MPKIVRDLSDTSSYWAAVWTICPMPDTHIICDAPIGCFNLVATAVPDYTDAIPHIENITPSVIRDEEVGGGGTGPAVQRTYEGLRDEGLLDGKKLIVISTAESEMIGSDLTDLVTQLAPGTTFFHSESLTEDEWEGRDRVLQWLWEQYGAAQAADIQPEPGLVNIIGPTYGCFNSPSDLQEVKRMIEGAGGTINRVYPMESTLAQTPELAKAAVNVVLYREFGSTLAESLGQPVLYAPVGMRASVAFVTQLGELLGTQDQAAAFIQHEKRTTLQAVWDLWRGPQSDWFSTTSFGVVAPRTYAEGLNAYLHEELGMPAAFVVARPGGLSNDEVRRLLHKNAPAFVFGSINEKIYLSEAGARRSNFIPAAFPGPIVRRAVGTPFMGFRGAVIIVQEIVNRLYETLFNVLPLDGAYAKAGGAAPGGPPSAPAANGGSSESGPGNLPWTDEAKALLDAAIAKLPLIAQISASRELQMQVESAARAQGMTEVNAELAASVLEST